MPMNSKWIKNFCLLVCLLLLATHLQAQSVSRMSVEISFEKGGITGVCLLRKEEQTVSGTIMNEFGIKVFDFVYYRQRDKLRLFNVIKMLDKWYIRRVVRRDLKQVLPHLPPVSEYRYENRKRHIHYLFTPLPTTEDEATE